MEVVIPDVVVPPEFNFRDLDLLAGELEENKAGSYSSNLALFMEEEKHKLRVQFVPENHPNRDAFLQVFHTYSQLMKHTLEEIWYAKFEADDIQRKLVKLEGMMTEAGTVFENFKKELSGSSVWMTALRLSSADLTLLRKLADTDRHLRAMKVECDHLLEKYEDLKKTEIKFLNSKIKVLEMLVSHIERSNAGDISGQLRKLLINRQILGHTENRAKCHEARTSLLEKLNTILEFRLLWTKWLGDLSGSIGKRGHLINFGVWGSRIVLNMYSIDPCMLETADMSFRWDLIKEIWNTMHN